MTYRKDFTLPAEILERVSKQGLDILPELIHHLRPAFRWCKRMKELPPSCSITHQ